ncbi:MAG TPA: DUF1822 family protein [Crinalium sp.]
MQHPFTFTVPLTLETHQTAQEFYRHHAQPQKAKQVYLNTLSVQAVQVYLTCLGIETNLQQSQSWNPLLQSLADTADLWVSDRGRLECRPVLPNEHACSVPMEVWGDRMGYVMVQLNAELTEATLLGFLPAVETETVALTELRSLDDFPAFLSQLAHIESVCEPIVLHRWLTQLVDTGWETLERLRQSLQGESELAYSFRQASSSALEAVDIPVEGIKRGKLLSLQDAPDELLVLLVCIHPSVNTSEFQITVELLPTHDQHYLPRSLQLLILDEANQVVLQADGSNSEGLEFQFAGDLGERFTVRVQWQNGQIEEAFEI